MNEKLYTYYLFYIKPEYSDVIGFFTSNKPLLYAYTDKKKYAARFLMIHKKEAFVIKKKKISRSNVNQLAKEQQNDYIGEYRLSTKDHNGNTLNIDICITPRQFMVAEARCYTEIENVWKYVWASPYCFKRKYIDALITLDYLYNYSRLENGDTLILPHMEPDLFGSLIRSFNAIMRDNLCEYINSF